MAVKHLYLLLFAVMAMLIFTSCEAEYFPEPSIDGPKYVVEGYIEAGPEANPAFLFLTRTFNFYSEIGAADFDSSYVHDAIVDVFDGSKTVRLQEVCIDDLDEESKKQFAEVFGFDADSLAYNFCIYIDVFNVLQAKEGRTYELNITVDGDTITSTTYIPIHVPLDSLTFLAPPGDPNDTLAQLACYISDPAGEQNYYRILGATNGGALETGLAGVEEDLYFDGKSFEFQLLNPQTSNGDVDPEVFGLYFVGDTVTIKWASIDEATFDFWNTLEFAQANQGPFSSYTRIQTNIVGGIGVWGGYSVSYYTKIVDY